MQWWAEGGFFMYVVLAAAALIGVGVGLSFVSAVVAWFWRPLRTAARLIGILGVFATVTPLVVGMVGWFYNRSVVDAALMNVDPANVEQIRAVGYAEARHPMDLGSALTCVLLVPAALAAMVALTVPAPKRDDDDE
jgi:ABC-type methionine transport system permease subunit